MKSIEHRLATVCLFLCVLAVPVGSCGIAGLVRQIRPVPPRMCGGGDIYRHVAEALRGPRRVRFVSSAPEDQAAEAYFCLQLELLPTLAFRSDPDRLAKRRRLSDDPIVVHTLRHSDRERLMKPMLKSWTARSAGFELFRFGDQFAVLRPMARGVRR